MKQLLEDVFYVRTVTNRYDNSSTMYTKNAVQVMKKQTKTVDLTHFTLVLKLAK